MLTLRQEKFIIEYIKSSNATKSAEIAGYKGKNVRKYASELLTKPDITRRIDEVRSQIDTQGIADCEERQRVLTDILRDNLKNEKGIPIITPRIQAIAELNRMDGLTDKQPININFKQVIDRVRELEEGTIEGEYNATE